MIVQRCTSCGRHAYPARLWCPDCGGDGWEDLDVDAGRGVIESETTLRDGTRLGTLRLEHGPRVVVRLDRGESG